MMPKGVLLSWRDLNVSFSFASCHSVCRFKSLLAHRWIWKQFHSWSKCSHSCGKESKFNVHKWTEKSCQQIISSICPKCHSALSTLVQLWQIFPAHKIHTPPTAILHLCQRVWNLAKSAERLPLLPPLLTEAMRGLVRKDLEVGGGVEVMEVVDCRRLYRSLREPSVITDFRQIPQIPWYPDNAAALSDRL